MLHKYIPYYKRNLHLALPLVLSQAGQVTVSLVDNMMVGHVGTTELAASSFANNIFMIGMLFGMGITIGLTPMVGSEFGKNNTSVVASWLKNGFITHFAASVLLAIIMFSIYFVIPFMGQTPDVEKLAKPYYLLLCSSLIPFMLFFTFKQFFEGIGNTKIAMQITLISNVVNIVVNYLFIFGKFGMPELGLNGAGIGMLVSRIIMPILFFIAIYRSDSFIQYFKKAYHQKIDFDRILSVLKIGIPIAFQIIVEVTAFGFGAIMMGWIGEIPLAGHQVAIGLASFTYMISLGISQANTIRVSHNFGEKNFAGLKNDALASTHLVLFFMLTMGLIFVFFRIPLSWIFTSDPAVIEMASNLLIIAAVFQVFDGLQVVMLSTLRGMKDVHIPMLFAFLAYLVLGIPVSYVMAFKLNLGPSGIWYGYLVGLFTAGILFYFRFKFVFKNT